MFFSLQESAFLHALGSAIGNSLWQMAGLWLVFAAISGVMKLNPSHRYRLAVFFSAAGFVWFIESLVVKYILISSAPPAVWDVYQNMGTPVIANGFYNKVSFVYQSLLVSLTSLLPYISSAYMFVWLLLVTRLINGFRQVKQFGTKGLGKVHIDVKIFVQKQSSLLQIQKKVRIFTSAYIQSPLTIGFFKPLILLPVASMAHLSTEQVEAILLHELAHIKRHDYLVNIFVQVAEITLFFNPFMRLLLKQIKQERENCCDDYVLQFQYNAADYAKALLGIAQNRTATLLAMGAKNNQFQLLNRVKRMVAPQPQTFNYRQQLYMLCLITILGLGVTMVVPNSLSQTKKTAFYAKQAPQITTVPAISISEKEKVYEHTSLPTKAFDLVKSVTHFADVSENGTDEEIENEGRIVEQNTKELTDDALETAKPVIEKSLAFSKKLVENMANAEKQKQLADIDFNTLFSQINENINDAMHQVSQNIRVAKPLIKFEAPVLPVPPTPKLNYKFLRQTLPERKALITKEQLEEQETTTKKSMDSLQSALVEFNNTKTQEAINKAQAKLLAINKKENWDVDFNENEETDIPENHISINYKNKMGKIVKRFINGFTKDVNKMDLNNIEVELKSELNKMQTDINIRFNGKLQERTHRKTSERNTVDVSEEDEQGS